MNVVIVRPFLKGDNSENIISYCDKFGIETTSRKEINNVEEKFDYYIYVPEGIYFSNFLLDIREVLQTRLYYYENKDLFIDPKSKIIISKTKVIKNPMTDKIYEEQSMEMSSGEFNIFSTKNIDFTGINFFHNGEEYDIMASLEFVFYVSEKNECVANYIFGRQKDYDKFSNFFENIGIRTTIYKNQPVHYILDDFRQLGEELKRISIKESYFKVFGHDYKEYLKIKKTFKDDTVRNISVYCEANDNQNIRETLFDWEYHIKNNLKENVYYLGKAENFEIIERDYPKVFEGCIENKDINNFIEYFLPQVKNFYGGYYTPELLYVTNYYEGVKVYTDDGFFNKPQDLKKEHLINDKNIDYYLHNVTFPKNKLKLPKVTLVCVDCVDIERALRAVSFCQEHIEFEEVKVLSSIESQDERVVHIHPKIRSILEYSNFMLGELSNYINTDYCLVIQHDGFVYNSDAWQDIFLKYDYIGANVVSYDGPEDIQNGGFSLRSKKLLEEVKNIFTIERNPKGYSEDYYIFKLKERLESKNLKFPPKNISDEFSVEPLAKALYYKQKPFGFHYAISKD